jgi:hypothetical protein
MDLTRGRVVGLPPWQCYLSSFDQVDVEHPFGKEDGDTLSSHPEAKGEKCDESPCSSHQPAATIICVRESRPRDVMAMNAGLTSGLNCEPSC